MSRPFHSRSFAPRAPVPRRNGKIRAREVRVLDETRQPVGVMSLTDALRLAQSKGLDLIEIAPTATPPVCRIIEYGKFQYEESKKSSQVRQPANQTKEIQLSANIDPHDLQIKVEHAIRFLCDDMKVRVKLRFRGRQRAHKEFGFEIVNRFVRETAAYGRSDSQPKMAGERDLHVLISPLPRDQRARPPADTHRTSPDPGAPPPPEAAAHT